MSIDPLLPSVEVATGAVPEGKVADFMRGRHVKDTPEEYVTQNLERARIRQYRFAEANCEPEFTIRVGSSRKLIDGAVIGSDAEHVQENIHLIVRRSAPGTARAESTAFLSSSRTSRLA